MSRPYFWSVRLWKIYLCPYLPAGRQGR